MRSLITWIRQFAFGLNMVAGLTLIATMLVVLLEIATRTVFGLSAGRIDLTFTGSFELVRWGLLFTLAFCMPYSLPRAQVVVDLFTDNMSERKKEILAGIYTLLFGVFGFLMAYLMVESIEGAIVSGETSQDLLIPMQYIYSLVAVGMLVLGLRGFSVAYEQLFLTKGKDS